MPLRNSPDHIEVVDFNLHRGHATLLFSDSSQNVRIIYSLTVRDEAVLIRSHHNRRIVLLSPETGKIAIVTVENVSMTIFLQIFAYSVDLV